MEHRLEVELGDEGAPYRQQPSELLVASTGAMRPTDRFRRRRSASETSGVTISFTEKHGPSSGAQPMELAAKTGMIGHLRQYVDLFEQLLRRDSTVVT